MELRDLVLRNRSCRRFHQEASVSLETLKQLVDLARMSASGNNLQPLKYVLSCDPERNALIYPHLGWAAYLTEWEGPAEGERPSAYIIILGDRTIRPSFGCDQGIAAQSILLGATERELGGCIIGTIRREELQQELGIPIHLEILLILALGRPDEKVMIEPVESNGDIKYWRDDEGTHHVPKRSLEDVIIGPEY